MTSSNDAATSAAHFSRSKPVVSSVSRMLSRRRATQSNGSAELSSGSPPEKTIQRTPSRRIESRWGTRSSGRSARICCVFQMSHMMQRQLQELCA